MYFIALATDYDGTLAHAFLKACGCSVAVDNAIPAVKTTADMVTRGARGKGVEELIDRLIKRDHDILPRRHGPFQGRARAVLATAETQEDRRGQGRRAASIP